MRGMIEEIAHNAEYFPCSIDDLKPDQIGPVIFILWQFQEISPAHEHPPALQRKRSLAFGAISASWRGFAFYTVTLEPVHASTARALCCAGRSGRSLISCQRLAARSARPLKWRAASGFTLTHPRMPYAPVILPTSMKRSARVPVVFNPLFQARKLRMKPPLCAPVSPDALPFRITAPRYFSNRQGDLAQGAVRSRFCLQRDYKNRSVR